MEKITSAKKQGNKIHLIYIGVIVLLLLLFGIREYFNQKAENKYITELISYKSEAKHYKDKFGKEIATNQALLIKTQDQIKGLLGTNDSIKEMVSKFSKVYAGVTVKENITIKEVAMPFEVPIPCDFKPFPVEKVTNDYQIYTTISKDYLGIDSIIIPNEATIIIGEKKSGFLGAKKEYSIDVRNSNSLMRVSDIQGYSYVPEKKWHEKGWFKFLGGAVVGSLTTIGTIRATK